MPTLRGKWGPERKLADLKLYLRPNAPRDQRGRPLMAKGKRVREVIEWIKKASAQFGTSIEFQDGIGVVKP